MPYSIADIELTHELRPVQLKRRESGIAVVLRHRGRPIAFWMSRTGPGRLISIGELERQIERNARQVVVRARLRDELEEFQGARDDLGNDAKSAATGFIPSRAEPPSLCLAVCTHGRPQRLRRCLESLLRIERPDERQRIEFLVIDNAPPDEATRREVERFAQVRYHREDRPGLDFARNRALHESSCDWVAFLDDDVCADPLWLRGWLEAWRDNPDAGAITGLVLPLHLHTRAQILFETSDGFRRGFERVRYGAILPGNDLHPTGSGLMGVGANMSVRRDLALSMGGFDIALDTGKPLPGGGDLDIFLRVVHQGWPLVYEPACAVFHEHRRDMKGLRHQYYTWGLGFMAYCTKIHRSYPGLRERLRRLLGWWVLDTLRRLARVILRRDPRPWRMVRAELWGALVGYCGEYDRSLARVAAIEERHALTRTPEPSETAPLREGVGARTKEAKSARFAPWRVLHLDLGDPVPELVGDECGGVFLVIWWCGVPLGHLMIDRANLPLPSGALRAMIEQEIPRAVGDHLFDHGFRAQLPDSPAIDRPADSRALLELERPLATLRARWDEEDQKARGAGDSEAITVVICTHERPADLQRCLESLARQQAMPARIVVVDNAPLSDATRRVTTQFAARDLVAVSYVLEPELGLSRARNAGIAACSTPLIAFTDDDVEAHPGWIKGVIAGLSHPGVMAVTGPVLPARLDTAAQVAFQREHQTFDWGYQAMRFDQAFFQGQGRRGPAPTWRIGAGANMGFRREAFDIAGGFDQRLGAGASGCSEDSEMWYRLLAAGLDCRYEPRGAVFHHHRAQTSVLARQMRLYMRGHLTALLIQWRDNGHYRNLWRAYATLPAWYGRLTLRQAWARFRRRPAPVPQLKSQIQGCFEGTLFYWRCRGQARFQSRDEIVGSREAPDASDAPAERM